MSFLKNVLSIPKLKIMFVKVFPHFFEFKKSRVVSYTRWVGNGFIAGLSKLTVTVILMFLDPKPNN